MLRERPNKLEEKERVRLALLRAALELSAAHGFASLGLREVSRAAGIAPTSFYRHFPDMNELGLALIQERVEPMLRELADAVQTGDPRALVPEMLRLVGSDPELVRFLVSERNGAFPRLRAELVRILEAFAVKLELGERAQIVLALMLEGFARALDAAEPERSALSERWVAALGHAWRSS